MLTTLLLPLLLLSFGETFAQKPFIKPGFSLGKVKEQIGEIMIICGENPTTCECGNGRTLKGENFFPAIFGCNPISCECPNGLSINNLDDIEDDKSLTVDKFRTMMSIGNFMEHWSHIGDKFHTFCDGEVPTSCSCQDGEEIRKFKKSSKKLGICRPQICQCPDGSSKEVPDNMKYSFLNQMADMCEVQDCSCTKSSSKIIPPFELVSQIEECAPDQCTCVDGEVKNMPTFPDIEDNLIDTLKEYGKKRLRGFLNLCNGELPSFCECIKRKEVLTSFTDKEEMKKCYPSTCTCLDGSKKAAPTKRGSFDRILDDMEIKVGEEEMDKMTLFYEGKYSKFIPGLSKPGSDAPSKFGGFPGGPPGGKIPDFVLQGKFPGGFPKGKIPDFVRQLNKS